MSSDASEGLLFFALFTNGGLAGAVYALIALAFVLVYKASRMINFALGEWIMFGALLTSTGSHTIGLGLGGAVLRGVAAVCFHGVPGAIDLPVPTDPVPFLGIDIAGDKLVAALIAALCI